MRITLSPLLLFIAVFATLVVTKVAGQHHSYSLRAIQDERHPTFLKNFQPFPETDLGNLPYTRIGQQCEDETLALYATSEYANALGAWAAEVNPDEYECNTDAFEMECSVDSASFPSHDPLVRVCEEKNGLSFLFTYSTMCDILFDDGSSIQVTYMDMNIPECVASSCTIDELEKLVQEKAEKKADFSEQNLSLNLASVESVVCTASDPTSGTPTKPSTTADSTVFPTPASSQVDPEVFPNLSQTMVGVSPLTSDSWQTYEEEYTNFYTAFYNANPQFGVSDVDIVLEFVSQDPLLTRRLGDRQLQETLTLVYNQAITYAIVPGSDITTADVVTQPFASQTSRDSFASLLRESGDVAFANIQSVSGLTQSSADTSTGTSDPTTLPNPTTTMAPPITTTKPSITTPGSTTTLDAKQQCEADTDALFQNPQFASAYEAWWAEFDADRPFCTGVCIYDSKEYSSHDAFLSACEQAGGDSFLFSDSFYCSGSDSLYEYTLDFRVVDHPQCIAKSCDANEYVAMLSSAIDDMAQKHEEESSDISNYQCTSSDASVTGLPPGRLDETSSAYTLPKVLGIGMMGIIAVVVMI